MIEFQYGGKNYTFKNFDRLLSFLIEQEGLEAVPPLTRKLVSAQKKIRGMVENGESAEEIKNQIDSANHDPRISRILKTLTDWNIKKVTAK